jgi:hypothetical protein
VHARAQALKRVMVCVKTKIVPPLHGQASGTRLSMEGEGAGIDQASVQGRTEERASRDETEGAGEGGIPARPRLWRATPCVWH